MASHIGKFNKEHFDFTVLSQVYDTLQQVQESPLPIKERAELTARLAASYAQVVIAIKKD